MDCDTQEILIFKAQFQQGGGKPVGFANSSQWAHSNVPFCGHGKLLGIVPVHRCRIRRICLNTDNKWAEFPLSVATWIEKMTWVPPGTYPGVIYLSILSFGQAVS